ncbi:MAG: hypothetical protein KF897_03205 [Opitutaceae bacterium]|nr:hypothetical protein [Opitutaceae bacterium]
MLDLHLLAFAPDHAKPDPTMLATHNRARKLRNEFMHEGTFTSERATIEESITTSETFLRYLRQLRQLKSE